MKRHLLTLIILAITITSCTIEKRIHRGGWHVEWKGHYRGTADETSSEHQSGNLADAPAEKKQIRPDEAASVAPEKKLIEKTAKSNTLGKVAETTAEEQIQQVNEPEIIKEQPSTGEVAEAIRPSLTDEKPSFIDEKADESAGSELTQMPKTAEDFLPVDPLMIAAYIISAVIMLGLILYCAGPLLAFSFGIGFGFGWIFTLGYVILGVANFVLLGLLSARQETMSGTYRYPRTWPVWVATLLPLVLGLIALTIILIILLSL